MTLHLTYEERKKRTYQKYLEYKERHRERLIKYNKEYYEKNIKNNNKYYNKVHTKNIYSNNDTKKDKERKLLYIMDYFISNNIIWT
jgi:hypothetical protein